MGTSAATMYIYGVFNVLIFFKGQCVKQQRHKQKKVVDKAEPA